MTKKKPGPDEIKRYGFFVNGDAVKGYRLHIRDRVKGQSIRYRFKHEQDALDKIAEHKRDRPQEIVNKAWLFHRDKRTT